MSFEKEIFELREITAEEYGDAEAFIEIYEYLWDNADNSIITNLCSVFNDNMSYDPLIGNFNEMILNIANRCGLESGMVEIAKGTPRMLPQGKEWAIRMHKLILNSEPYINFYINAIKEVDEAARKVIVDILNQIKKQQPSEYSNKVDKILEELC
ncbi:Imm30 family immunity protein [Clostridium sp. DJ247]|uniref:Imm30 family immunity protein n=1 Tax=Clostridium sp. DJ247 TaxID=2726188 RepID=UPI00162AF540|nr:Imm30 family immunity protein [Clostridium sp. DJ247]MBC2582892.1 hypothetical protein [Clostridium sp. DJ247]